MAVSGPHHLTHDTFLREGSLTSVPDYPAYELYTDVLRQGIFPEEKGKQLRLVVGKDRKVQEVEII